MSDRTIWNNDFLKYSGVALAALFTGMAIGLAEDIHEQRNGSSYVPTEEELHKFNTGDLSLREEWHDVMDGFSECVRSKTSVSLLGNVSVSAEDYNDCVAETYRYSPPTVPFTLLPE